MLKTDQNNNRIFKTFKMSVKWNELQKQKNNIPGKSDIHNLCTF